MVSYLLQVALLDKITRSKSDLTGVGTFLPFTAKAKQIVTNKLTDRMRNQEAIRCVH